MSGPTGPVVVVGECMLELTRSGGGWVMGAGGDTWNTAVHLLRWGRPELEVRYASVLGGAGLAGQLSAAWAAEGVSQRWSRVVPAGQPSLYVVEVDAGGERSFSYYREASPVRSLLAGGPEERLEAALDGAALVHLSGVTLSLLTSPARRRLLELVGRVRAAGAVVTFDPNYRPSGWPDEDVARAEIDAALACTDIALPTLGDEARLHGDTHPEQVVARLARLGVGECAVKLGAEGAWVHGAEGAGTGRLVPAPEVLAPVDTTGAGDAFDAGYLWARLAGHRPVAAAGEGHRLAGAVVMAAGAVPPAATLPGPPAVSGAPSHPLRSRREP